MKNHYGFNMGCWMEYIGAIPKFQGKRALLRPVHQGDLIKLNVLIKLDPNKYIMAQFPDIDPDWRPFPKADFQEPGAKPVF